MSDKGGVENEGKGEVSLCIVIGGEGMNTIKLLGTINKQQIVILWTLATPPTFGS